MTKLKKKTFSRILSTALVSALLLTGCGSNSDGTKETTSVSDGVQTESIDDTSDTAAVDTEAENTDTDYSDITLTYAVTSSWDSTMPYLHTSQLYSMEVYDKLFDTLVYIDDNYEVQPRAAESWVMEDPQTIVFNLNKDAAWHDGEPVTAYDWVFTLNLISDPDVVVTKTSFSVISGADGTGNRTGDTLDIEARDEYTLVIHLTDPTYDEDFLQKSIVFYVLPEHLLKDIAPADLLASDFWNNPIGSGPCRFVSEVAGTEIVVEPNENYQLGAPKFGKLIIKVVDYSNAITAMAAGEIDALGTPISVDEAETVEELYDNISVNVNESAANQYYILINNEKYNARVRHALDIAIDKQLLVDQLLLGKGVVSTTNVSTVSKYYNPNVSFEYNPEEAKKILEEEGWDESQTVKMAISTGLFERLAPIIQQEWKEIGVNLEVEVVDGATKFAGVYDGTYDMCLGYTVSAYRPTFYEFDPDGGTKVSPQTDTYHNYIQQIRTEQDEAKRIEISGEMQELIAEEVPIIFLFDQYIIDIRSARSRNITTQGTDQVWNWTAID